MKLYKRPTRWTPGMADQLKALYASVSNAELARRLGVDRKTIYRQARRLGLPVKRFGGQYKVTLTMEQVGQWVRQGKTISQISRDTGCTRDRIRDMVPPGLESVVAENGKRVKMRNLKCKTTR